MKGWEFTTTHVPLKLVEKPDPVIEPGKVILDVKAAGLCHSDVGALEDEGWLEIITKRPLILGHEIAGVISEIGEGVTDYKVGDEVGVCPVGLDGTSPGYHYDGGYATKTMVPMQDLVPIPKGVSFAQAAAGTDAGMTSYHAMFLRGGAKPGMKVGVIGMGGLGQIAARVAVVRGIEVYAVDVSPSARDLAKEIGCTGVFENVMDLAPIGCDLIVDYAGFGTTTADAILAVAERGIVVQVGMGRLEACINTRALIMKSLNLLGSMGGTKQDIVEVYNLIASGDLNPVITEITFDEIGEGLGRLARGEVKGRLVAVL